MLLAKMTKLKGNMQYVFSGSPECKKRNTLPYISSSIIGRRQTHCIVRNVLHHEVLKIALSPCYLDLNVSQY